MVCFPGQARVLARKQIDGRRVDDLYNRRRRTRFSGNPAKAHNPRSYTLRARNFPTISYSHLAASFSLDDESKFWNSAQVAKKQERALRKILLPDWHQGADTDPVVEAVRECALQIVEHIEPDETAQLGDFLDCGAFSTHGKTSVEAIKNLGFVEDEVIPGRKILDRIQAATRGRVHVLMGNHEKRAESFGLKQGLHGNDLRLLMPSHLLRIRSDGQPRKNFSTTPYVGQFPHHKVAPNLIIAHGLSVAKNAVEVCLSTVRSSSIAIGHIHRYQEVSTRNPLTNETFYGWSPGCLCSREPGWLAHSPSTWAWGITLIYQSRTNPLDWTHFNVHIIEIDGGVRAILPDGKAIHVKAKRI